MPVPKPGTQSRVWLGVPSGAAQPCEPFWGAAAAVQKTLDTDGAGKRENSSIDSPAQNQPVHTDAASHKSRYGRVNQPCLCP